MKVRRVKNDGAALNSKLIRRPIQRWFWLFLLPTFASFCIGFVYPFLKGLFLSFCKFKTTSKWTWIGLKNYGTIFRDASFLHAFWYTALFAVISLVIINVLAFAVAYALTRGMFGAGRAYEQVRNSIAYPKFNVKLCMLLGKMPLKKRFIYCHALDPLGPLSLFAVHDPVHQRKGIAMGQNLGNLVGIKLHSHCSRLPFLQQDAAVVPAKAQRVGQGVTKVAVTAGVWHHVQIAGGVRNLIVDGCGEVSFF